MKNQSRILLDLFDLLKACLYFVPRTICMVLIVAALAAYIKAAFFATGEKTHRPSEPAPFEQGAQESQISEAGSSSAPALSEAPARLTENCRTSSCL